MAENKPNDLSSWRNELRQLKLPVNPGIKKSALQKLQSGIANAQAVADIAHRDPALSLLLMHEANKSLSRSGNETHDLAHAISLLGFPKVETVISDTESYDKKTFPYLKQYLQQLAISIHAAHQAERWAVLNAHWPQDTIYYSTLFNQAISWVLWYRAGEQMEQLQHYRANNNGSHHSDEEQKVFGTTLQRLSKDLSSDWHLPTLTQQSWQPSLSGSARQWIMLSRIIPEKAHIALEAFPRLQKSSNHPALLISLANRLADHVEWNWYSHHSLRLQKILATISNQPLDTVTAMIHQQASCLTQSQRMPKTAHPAAQLLAYYQKAEAIKEEKLTQTTSKTSTTAKAPGKTPSGLLEGAPSSFVTVIERLQTESFDNIHDVMNIAVSSLCQDIKLERASASLLNLKNRELRSYYSSGAEDSPALKNFRHTLQQGDLFNKLLQKPLSVRLHSGNYASIWPLLPGDFKQACGVDQFLMMSIFAGKKPIAVIYADRGKTNRPISDQQYSFFKQLCSAVSRCLAK